LCACLNYNPAEVIGVGGGMLKKISLRNYRAFSEAELELKPFTLLIGPNNSGKTSLISLFLAIQQTALFPFSETTNAIKINGKLISLGSVENLFNNRNTNIPISIGFTFSSQDLANSIGRMKTSIIEQLENVYRYKQLVSLERNPHRFKSYDALFKEFEKNPIRSITDYSSFKKSLSRALDTETDLNKYLSINARAWPFESSFSSFSDLDMSAQLLFSVIKEMTKEFRIDYDLRYEINTKSIQIERVALLSANKAIVEVWIDHSNKKLKSISSDYLSERKELRNYYPAFGKSLRFQNTLFDLFIANREKSNFRIIETMIELLTEALGKLAYEFNSDRMLHVSPIRAYPRRYYFDDEIDELTIDGNNIIGLLKKRPNLIAKANDWLNKFEMSLDIEDLRDILRRLIIRQKDVSVDLDITDVGFGVSQVLPVLICAFMVKSGGIAIIEQPEIHLHPRMQADLVNFFFESIKTVSQIDTNHTPCCFIIETHSEAMLRRMRSCLVSRETSGSNSTVAIYSMGKNSAGQVEMKRLEISESGKFEWPKEYLDVELKDTINYLKHA
jgi:predicted ATPase